MHQPEAYGSSGVSDVKDRYGSLQLVVPGLVKEVAQADHSHSFPNKVHREARSGTAKYADQRIQLLASALQVGTCYREVGAI